MGYTQHTAIILTARSNGVPDEQSIYHCAWLGRDLLRGSGGLVIKPMAADTSRLDLWLDGELALAAWFQQMTTPVWERGSHSDKLYILVEDGTGGATLQTAANAVDRLNYATDGWIHIHYLVQEGKAWRWNPYPHHIN